MNYTEEVNKLRLSVFLNGLRLLRKRNVTGPIRDAFEERMRRDSGNYVRSNWSAWQVR